MVHPLETEDAAERCARQLWGKHDPRKPDRRIPAKDDIIGTMVAVFITTYKFRQQPEGYEEPDSIREWRDEAFQAYTRMVVKAFERILAEETRSPACENGKTLAQYFAMFSKAGSDSINCSNTTTAEASIEPTTNGASRSNDHVTNGTATGNGNEKVEETANGTEAAPSGDPFELAEFDGPFTLDKQVSQRRLKPAVTTWPPDIADKNEHDHLRRLWIVLDEDKKRLAEEEAKNEQEKEKGKREKASSTRRGGSGAKGRKERRRQKHKEREEEQQS